MLATVLAREPERLSARIALWRQLLDLLAQHRGSEDRTVARAAFERLVAMRAEVPVDVRCAAAVSIAGRPVSPATVALIAGDVPLVAGAILSRVRLADTEWLMLLPRLSPTARGFLRHRRDLGAYVEAALAGFGTSDLSLSGAVGPIDPDPAPDPIDRTPAGEIAPAPRDAAPSGAGPTPATETGTAAADAILPHHRSEDEPELPLTGGAPDLVEPFEPGAGEGQIRAIISRIARFRSLRDDLPARDDPPDAEPAPADRFLFETGTDGVIRWVEGVPRGPLIGETVATPARGAYGVDAQAPGAFRRRAPFRDARLMVAGRGAASGEWRIAAVPVFAPATGRFLGYRGQARRPRSDERAEGAPAIGATATGPATGDLASSDSLRQLVHELRTPLNAIGGFAEMIRRQMRGPVSEAYRDRAERIADQAGQLLTAVDDLDISARLDSARIDLQRLAVDVPALLEPVCAELGEAAAARDVSIAGTFPGDLPAVIGDAAVIRRMATRLLAAASGLAAPGDAVAIIVEAIGPGALAIRITRPARLAQTSESALFDPGYGPDGDWPDAPLLGLGFSLHLVRRLATAMAGQLLVDADWFTLRLPIGEQNAGVGAV